jgi:hypothetical protein
MAGKYLKWLKYIPTFSVPEPSKMCQNFDFLVWQYTILKLYAQDSKTLVKRVIVFLSFSVYSIDGDNVVVICLEQGDEMSW